MRFLTDQQGEQNSCPSLYLISFSPPYQFIKYLDFRGGASASSDANTIYVFGGYSSNGPLTNTELYIMQSLPTGSVIIYIQDTNSTPSSRKWHTSVIDHTNKKMYVWGGEKVLYSGPIITQSDGTMYIYDIEKSIWTSNPTPNQPIGRQLHTATLLPDGRIIMIGGAFSSDVGQTATKYGFIPPIGSHSATLLPDNQNIIIYGGGNQTEYSGLAVLNTVNYVWTVISPTGNPPSVLSNAHRATLYFDVIIFAFGGFSINSSRYLMDTTIRILNISNGQYKWVDSFTPLPTLPNPNVQTSNANLIIIVSTIGENAVPYNPAKRTEFMSELISDKVYYFGGYGVNGAMNDFFYIDLTQPFYSFSPSYQFIKYLDFRGGASASSDANNIYVFGGYSSNGSPIYELYIIQSLSTDLVINYIQDTNSTPIMRKWHTSVIDHTNKKMYIWGGNEALNNIPDITRSDGTMYIYDIKQSTWTSNPTPNQPIGRQLHTATLLPDGRIIMIGGVFSSDIGQLDVYDTKTNQWTNIVATKNGVIPPISFHSATLLPDNQSILIYGGVNQTGYQPGYSGLAVLNLSNFVWTIISPAGRAPSSLSSGHKATLYFDVIIFAFGEYPFNNSRYLMDTTVRILNISNGQYRWVDSFTPPPTQNQSTNIQNPIVQTSNLNIIIIVSTIGGIVCIGILVLIGYIIHKKNRSKEFTDVTESSNEIRYGTESNNE
ncbi:3816_t:CDS:10, partial [Cetraspora pellucida]